VSQDVVYLHGLWLNGHESLVLRRRLQRDFGFRLHVFRYASVSSSLTDIIAQLAQFVTRNNLINPHFVGHSLGGLVIYRYLQHFPGHAQQRVVFLGTPSVACRAAENMQRWPPTAAMIGRSLREEFVRTRERRWSCAASLGIVAGTRPVGLGQLVARFNEPNDGTVALNETRLPGAADHLSLPVSHMGMLLSAKVAVAAGQFLRDGHFPLNL
jgi:pimeloyl-ACP methyl ester carboxylesterase